jgi:hypothetical protein
MIDLNSSFVIKSYIYFIGAFLKYKYLSIKNLKCLTVFETHCANVFKFEKLKNVPGHFFRINVNFSSKQTIVNLRKCQI